MRWTRLLAVRSGVAANTIKLTGSPAQGGPPLPMSLTALRLESTCPIDLGELARGAERLSAALAPVLSVRLPEIRFSVQSMFKEPKLGFGSQLPAGFVALELHAPCISTKSRGLPEFANDAAAAWQLCKFIARAPVSYKRFSLSCTGEAPMHIHVEGGIRALDPVSGRPWRRRRLSFRSLKTLAELMQHCVRVCNLRVEVIAESHKRLHVVRR